MFIDDCAICATGCAQVADLARFAAEAGRTCCRYEVRTPEEFAAGHLPGFRSAPDGQLVLFKRNVDNSPATDSLRLVPDIEFAELPSPKPT